MLSTACMRVVGTSGQAAACMRVVGTSGQAANCTDWASNNRCPRDVYFRLPRILYYTPEMDIKVCGSLFFPHCTLMKVLADTC